NRQCTTVTGLFTTSLKLDVVTRWHSLLAMLNSFYLNWFTLQKASQERGVDFPFTQQDLSKTAKLIGLLTPVKDLVDSYSKQSATCANLHNVGSWLVQSTDDTGLLAKIGERIQGLEASTRTPGFTETSRLLAWMQKPEDDKSVIQTLERLNHRLFKEESPEAAPPVAETEDSEMNHSSSF
ncbi:hypothetical protein Ciccas_012961, partial [Cichlidogyrus casuarinus]